MMVAPTLSVLRSLIASSTADEVWDVVGAFDQPQAWLPGIYETNIVRLPGQAVQRHCLTTFGGFRESLIETGPNWHIYTIDSGPLPVREYRSLIGVAALSHGHCGILWLSSFTQGETSASHAEKLVSDILDAGTSRLQSLFRAERVTDRRWLHWGLPIDKVVARRLATFFPRSIGVVHGKAVRSAEPS